MASLIVSWWNLVLALFSYNSVFALYDDPGDVVILSHENFSEKVLESSDVWFVEFYAPWCSHCQKLAPEYKKAAAEMKGAVHFGVVNCDDQKTLAEQFSISGYPTIKIFGRDKKAPTEYQSMRTMEALRKAALTALNELMEGSKVAKKREPKVIMDTPEDEAGKQVSDQEPEPGKPVEETGTKKPKKDSEPKPGESKKQGGSEDARIAKPTETDKANKIKPSKAAKKTADTENVPSILEYAEPEEEKVDQKGQSADQKASVSKENTEKRKAEVDDREKPGDKERKQEEPSVGKPETKAGDKEGEDPKPFETKPKKRFKEGSEPEEGREKKKVTKAEKDGKPTDTADDAEANDSLNATAQENEYTAESAKKQKTTETPSDTEEDASGEPYAESPSGDSSVIALTDENFNSTVVSSEEPWLIEFYAPWCQYCRKFAPVYETIAKNLQGQVNVGAYDCDAEEVIANVYSIGNFPTLKLFPPGSKDLSDVITYDLSDMTAEDVQKWVNLQLSQLIPAPRVSQLTEQAGFDEACTNVPLCVIGFLPHILDCNAACRNDYLKTLKKLGDKYKKTQWGWLWAEAGAQPELEAALGVGGAGYPALAAVSTKKSRVATLRGAFSFNGIDRFLEALYMGGEATAPLKGQLPAVKAGEEWDGKDGLMPTEEDAGDEEMHQHEL